MKEVKIDGVSYQVPDRREEITLGHYLFNENHKEGTDLEREVALVSHVTGIPTEIFYKAEKTLYLKVKALLDALFEPSDEQKPSTRIAVDGVGYFHDDFKEITLAQYVDIDFRIGEHQIPNGEDEEGNPKFRLSPNVYPYILGILFLRPREEYNSKESAKRAELFKRTPLDEALGTMNFFLTKNERLKKLHQRSKEIQEALEAAGIDSPLHSPKSGVGSAP